MPYCVKQDIGTWLSGGEVTISKKKKSCFLLMLFSLEPQSITDCFNLLGVKFCHFVKASLPSSVVVGLTRNLSNMNAC